MPKKTKVLPKRNETVNVTFHIGRQELEAIRMAVELGLYIDAAEAVRDAIRRLILYYRDNNGMAFS